MARITARITGIVPAGSVVHDSAIAMEAAQITRSPVSMTERRATVVEAAPVSSSRRARMIEAIRRHLLEGDPEFQRFGPKDVLARSHLMTDYVFAVENEPHLPEDIFASVRWGGEFIYLSYNRDQVAALPEKFVAYGFETQRGPDYLKQGWLRFVPFLGQKLWYFVTRKLQLIRPRDITERFTYNVQLTPTTSEIPTDDRYVVLKEVPPFERVMDRLRAKFADAPYAVIEKRALKFTEQGLSAVSHARSGHAQDLCIVICRRNIACRVPTLLHMENDDRGYAKQMWMNWLRIGGKAAHANWNLPAKALTLLRVVHDYARIIHLDLRLDNFLITENGVCFVDFGSAVRDGENIQGNPLLSTLFEELMRTSQIQRMLYKMTQQWHRHIQAHERGGGKSRQAGGPVLSGRADQSAVAQSRLCKPGRIRPRQP